MRVLIAAAIMAFGLTTAARADLRYYIDHDVLRNNQSTALLHRAIKDIGTNPTGLVASLVRSADGDVGRRRLEPREGLGVLRTAFGAEPFRARTGRLTVIWRLEMLVIPQACSSNIMGN